MVNCDGEVLGGGGRGGGKVTNRGGGCHVAYVTVPYMVAGCSRGARSRDSIHSRRCPGQRRSRCRLTATPLPPPPRPVSTNCTT